MDTTRSSSIGRTWGFSILGGIVVGAIDSSLAGFLIGVALGFAIAQISDVRRRLDELQREIARLRASPASSTTTDRSPADATPASAQTQVTPEAAAVPNIASTGRSAPPPPPLPKPATRSERPRVEPPAPTWIDRGIASAIDWLKRGNPLARIGIVVLFFGAVFLAKYAADHALFPIELRFIALAAGAFALLAVGWRLREKRRAYAEVLQGGGIAGLYLTVFAAASLFKLLPMPLAFGLMVSIAFAAAVLAVAQNALSLAVIGTAGGFLAPILVSTGSGNHIALFSYYTILNLGIFTIAWFRTWRVLNVLGFVFTFTITGLWRASSYTPDEIVSADLFLILFFLLYVGVSILNCVRQPPNLKGYVSGSLVFGLPIVAFTLHATFVARIEYALAWSALAAGVFYLVLAFALLRSGRETFRLLVEAFAALGIIFGSLAIPLAFDTRTTAAMWAVEGAGLIWLGIRQHRKLARAFGALLQVAGGAGFLVGVRTPYDAMPVLNTAYLGAVMLALAGLFTGYVLHRNREHQASYERGAGLAFSLWGATWWLFGGVREIDRLTSAWPLGAVLIYVAITAVLLTLVGNRLEWRVARRIGLYLPVSVLLLTYEFLEAGHPFGLGGAPGWIAVFAAFYWMLHRAERDELTRMETTALHAGAAWLLMILTAWELAFVADEHAAGVWPVLPWGLIPAVALAVFARRSPFSAWPIARHLDLYRVLIAAPAAIACAWWIAIANLTSIGNPLWLPYLPLLNPLDMVVCIAIVSGALWWTSLDNVQRATVWPADKRALIALVAALVFLWLNAALIRSLHHNFGAPITLYGMARSQFVQAALSIFWAVLGFIAMTLAARKHWRYVWIVGAALMLVVVAKLFLVDLSNVGTIARIVSFLTIGALIVVTGYLAPLPPRRDSETRDSQSSAETVNP